MVGGALKGARYGLRDWLIQRASAVIAAGYSMLLLARGLWVHPHTLAQWQGLFDPLAMRLASELFLWSILLHAWVGVRDVVMDYIHAASAKLALYGLVILLLATYGLWGTFIVWRVI